MYQSGLSGIIYKVWHHNVWNAMVCWLVISYYSGCLIEMQCYRINITEVLDMVHVMTRDGTYALRNVFERVLVPS